MSALPKRSYSPRKPLHRENNIVSIVFPMDAWEQHKRQNPKLAKFLGLDAEPPRHKTQMEKNECV